MLRRVTLAARGALVHTPLRARCANDEIQGRRSILSSIATREQDLGGGARPRGRDARWWRIRSRRTRRSGRRGRNAYVRRSGYGRRTSVGRRLALLAGARLDLLQRV